MERIGNTARFATPATGRAMLIRSVEKFLRAHAIAPTSFGRLAAQDPRLVLDLRNGREPRGVMEARIRGFMAGYEAARETGRAA